MANSEGTHPHQLGFHIAPREGWLNDPNGLCQFRGRYHVFFQFNPDWPTRDTKHWRHMVSDDLLRWHDLGSALTPDIPEDRDGVWSGSALVRPGAASDGGDALWLYYTGNVIYPPDATTTHDLVHSGRDANQLLVTSEDGTHLSAKRVLLRNDDYPPSCTRHVRDPKVWEEDGQLWMLLGARDQDDTGLCLLFRSDDGLRWDLASKIRPRQPFGYMWECPNIVRLAGTDYLAMCPQGLPARPDRWHNANQAGYVALEGTLISTEQVDETAFVEWDAGFDFYAPQCFVDDGGRTLLVGWMGTFGDAWEAAPAGLAWCHCLTVPRELAPGTQRRIRQWPARELEGLRGEAMTLSAETPAVLEAHRADILLEGVAPEGALVLDDALELAWGEGQLRVRFLDDRVGAGRTSRSVPLARLESLRLLVDSTALELYVNGGELVFSTRWFPVADSLSIRCAATATHSALWPLDNASHA